MLRKVQEEKQDTELQLYLIYLLTNNLEHWPTIKSQNILQSALTMEE